MSKRVPKGFDYSVLSPDDLSFVIAATARIKLRAKRCAGDVVEMGHDLIEVKKRLPHGSFGKWLHVEFALSERTARNFMNVAERFGENGKLADLPPTALYELAAPSTPDEVVDSVEQKLAAGGTVTKADIKCMKADLLKAQKAKEQAEEDRQRAQMEVQLLQAHSEEQDSVIADLRDEVAKLEDEQVITMRPAEPDYADLKRTLLALWKSLPQSVRDWFFQQVPYPNVLPDVPVEANTVREPAIIKATGL